MRGSLMRRFTRQQHALILEGRTNKEAVAEYARCGLTVSQPLVNYWRKIFVDNEGKLSTTDNILKETRKLRKPDPDDDTGVLPDLSRMYHCILHIPDQHIPYHHKDMLPFLRAVKQAFQPDLVVNAGDEVDMHAMSFHDTDPNLHAAGHELEAAKPVLKQLHDLFPQQLVCSSNHGSMLFRKAKAHGIPVQMLKSYREVLFPKMNAEGWSWAYEWVVKTPLGDVMFRHQSADPKSDAAHNRCNLLVGHNHGRFGIEYAASSDYLYWGATGGCLIDNDAMAFAYGKHTKNKPIVGCTVILEGRPMLIPMVLDNEGNWIGRL